LRADHSGPEVGVSACRQSHR